MKISQSSLFDSMVMSPHQLFGSVNQCLEAVGVSPQLGYVRFQRKNKTESEPSSDGTELEENVVKKRKEGVGLKKLIREQKIKNIQRKFISKLKLNNVNSKPVEFNPYNQSESKSIFDKIGIQIPDWVQKCISGLIVINILICVFVETTYIAFPQIVDNKVVFFFQIFSLVVFTFQLIESMVVIKLVDGKKLMTIGEIAKNYTEDGMLMDIAYLIILIIDLMADAGWFRLIILLKLPQCFSRIEKLQNLLINTFYKEQYWGLAKVFLLNFSFSHLLCILLILISTLDPQKSWLSELNLQNAAWSEKYVWGFYWGTTIMLTVGFGDIAPANYKEAICIVLIETFSCLCLAYNINCVGNLIRNITSQDVQKNKHIKTFKMLSTRNSLTEHLEMKIHNYISECTNIKKKFNFQDESNFISTLPRELKAEFLKESNKKIFESLTFFKNLTEKTLLNFAEVIEMKICHPQEIIKKRGQISGVIILKEGKISLLTKLAGSDFTNTTIQTIEIKQSQDPFLLSLDFLSNDRATYQMKSQEYSFLYTLDREKTLQILKTSELDYEHFCFLRDKSRNLETDFEVLKCEQCKLNHSKFDCPKLHYCPLKKHVIDKYLHAFNTKKTSRSKFIRQKQVYNAFVELANNEMLFDLKSTLATKYGTYKLKTQPQTTTAKLSIDQNSKSFKKIRTQQGIYTTHSCTETGKDPEHIQRFITTQKMIECQYMAEYLKDELQKVMSNRNEVWLIETDEIKDFKFYFVSYNASTLEYLSMQKTSKSVFG